jgi:ketosteroid isomerase-like protein
MSREVARFPLRPLQRRSGRTLIERLTLAAPRLACLVRRAVLRLPPGSAVRRALLTKTLLGAYAALNRRDWDALLSMLHPEVEHHAISPPGEIATLDMEEHTRGPDGFLRFAEQWFESWDAFWIEPQEVIDFGDRLLVLVRRMGRGRGSGVALDQPAGDVLTLARGWLVRYDNYWAREDALKAVGLSE